MRQSEIMLRSWLRRLPIAKPLKRLMASGRPSEKDREREVLSTSVRAGDMVWDVGANGGGYAVRLARAAGTTGRVWAFEPAPDACEIMRQRVAAEGVTNVEIVQVALGDRTATVTMELGTAPGGRVSDNVSLGVPPLESKASPPTIAVPMTTGDEYRLRNDLPIPHFIKIDVEGFEIEVINGLHDTLGDAQCRAALCEVHFAQLEARGLRYGPIEVERGLKNAGFAVKWIGPSHILGTKPAG
jgi:FkbM family methyltransferase